MEQSHKEEMLENLSILIGSNRFKNKAVFAFGHCNATEAMVDYILANQIDVFAILDNNESKQGTAYKGIFVKSPDIINAFSASNSIVLIATRFFASMEAQLRRFGYDGEILKIVEYNTFADFSLSNDTFRQKKERVLQGVDTLKNISIQHPSKYLVVCPNNALGDVYWAMSFLPAYCEKHSIKEAAVIVVGNGCRQTAELFHNDVIMLAGTEMDQLVQAILFIKVKNCIVAHHDHPYTDNIINYLNRNFLSFIDYYKYAVYGLPKTAMPVLPLRNVEYTHKHRVKRGKTVILSPFSKSVVGLSESFWETVAEDYRKKGFLICTNVATGEKPIKGTIPLSIPINQMISAVEYAGCFVGIRSGLCDVVTTAISRKIVVFPDCMYSTTGIKVERFFHMPGWEQKSVIELCKINSKD